MCSELGWLIFIKLNNYRWHIQKITVIDREIVCFSILDS